MDRDVLPASRDRRAQNHGQAFALSLVDDRLGELVGVPRALGSYFA